MPINRLLKNKRKPEEIELLNKAFNHALDVADASQLFQLSYSAPARAFKFPLNYTRER
jgi:hypothetical protein